MVLAVLAALVLLGALSARAAAAPATGGDAGGVVADDVVDDVVDDVADHVVDEGAGPAGWLDDDGLDAVIDTDVGALDDDWTPGQLPDLLGFAAGPDPTAGAADRHGSPLGRLEVSAAWRRHALASELRAPGTVASPVPPAARGLVDELWLLATWRR